MKQFKQTDMWISIVLIVGFAIAGLVRQDYIILIGYFVVGGWQVISMIVHAWNHWFTRERGARFIYHWVTFFSLITMPMGFFWVLSFTAPFMAVYYTWLCYTEIHKLNERPLAVLK